MGKQYVKGFSGLRYWPVSKNDDTGYTTGEMAVKILKGESNVSDMPIEYTDVTKKYNKAICDDLGLTAPEGYEAIEG